MQTLTNLGLVSGAVFTDIDQDGQPDLALACEWGSIRVFHNEHGKFSEVPRPHLGSSASRVFGTASPRATSMGTADHLVASNWGRNWRTDEPPGVEEPYSFSMVTSGMMATFRL